MSAPLHVTALGGGVVLEGSPDTQQTDEVGQADSLAITRRGQLVVESDVSDYYTLKDLQAVPVAWTQLHGLGNLVTANIPFILAVGEGKTVVPTLRYFLAFLKRQGETVPIPATRTWFFVATTTGTAAPVPNGHGVYVTTVQFPGLWFGGNVILVNVGAREGEYPNLQPGLWFFLADPTAATGFSITGGNERDCLGLGVISGGTNGKQLYFRGITSYNGFAFGWGHDSADATNKDGPNRIMFSNINAPMVWGNDNVATAGDRVFTDSDAIPLGDAGEIVRAALKWRGRLYFGTNAQLHYIAGFGRDSFLTDGANPVAKSENVLGPYSLIEGPNRGMFGVGEHGLWEYDGEQFHPHYKKLIDFTGHSTGYWDLIWTDPTLALGIPGRTNQDLVWMASDYERYQVLIGIPFCNATLGYGVGNDTVVIKYHPLTGGFTRQVFLGVNYTAASYLRRYGQQRETRLLGTGTAGKVTLQRYGYQVNETDSPIMPSRLPVVKFGPYAPFGPDGEGVLKRIYLTLAWESAGSLPIVFAVTQRSDDSIANQFTLTIGPTTPGAPAAGDLWVDTSQTDTSIGNATAGALVPATGGFLTKTYSGSLWRVVPGGGQQGTRTLIPIPLARRVCTRVTVLAQCSAAAGRFSIEGFALNPGAGGPDA